MNRNRLARVRASEEGGWALVTSVALLAVMIGLGLAAFAMSDQQTRQTGRERSYESTLNLTEGVLSSQIFALSRNWPATAARAYTDCTQATATNPTQCPTPARTTGNFDAVDFRQATAWKTQVRDNGGGASAYYTDAVGLAQPRWDANNDGQVWVRAEGILGGRNRVIVARVKVESLPIRFPNGPFVAGSFATGNAGNKLIVDTKGTAGVVRCSYTPPATRGNACASYDFNKGQVNGPVTSSPSLETNLIQPEMLDALRQTAKANGTYYTGCPANPTGKVVFVEGSPGEPVNCDYNNSAVKNDVNSVANPGVFIVNYGVAGCSGNITWFGAVYMVNGQNTTNTVFGSTGGCTVQGGIFIDGPGRLEVGSNKMNLVYDPALVLNATAYGTAGIVQNTWREYQP